MLVFILLCYFWVFAFCFLLLLWFCYIITLNHSEILRTDLVHNTKQYANAVLIILLLLLSCACMCSCASVYRLCCYLLFSILLSLLLRTVLHFSGIQFYILSKTADSSGHLI